MDNLLTAQLEAPEPNKPDDRLTADIEARIKRRQIVTAEDVKRYRQATHLGLKECREYLDGLLSALPWYSANRIHLIVVVRPLVCDRYANGLMNHRLLADQVNVDVRLGVWEDRLEASYKPQINLMKSDTGLIPQLMPYHVGVTLNWQSDPTSATLRLSVPEQQSPMIFTGVDALAWMLQSLLIRHNPSWWTYERSISS